MTKRFAELDGLRIVAAMLVLMSHLVEVPETNYFGPIGVLFDGGVAVLIFFVLSGFVITGLLTRELDRTGSIALRQFYLRRALRIWPASYAYILVALVCVSLHFATARPQNFILAATHLWNYSFTLTRADPSSQGFTIFGHFWSLALEEQFYWAWPLAMLLLRGRATKVLIVIIAIMPVVRIVSYVLFPFSRGQLTAMFHTGIDPIALGALLSLSGERLRPQVARLSPWLFYANLAFLLVLCPVLEAHLRGFWTVTYGRTLEAASAGLLIIALIHGPQTRLAWLLRTWPMQFGGRISYSLYVWQQLFTLRMSIFPQGALMAIALSLAAATASYYLIELPFLRLKDRLAP
ncbi:acyltransferase family protein [Novosphingobium sp.]|uniref:acyltransferase family protein n=1 Tax=Novosphingobium sp. TaxID=1874826 RepID=UPI003B52A1FA